MSDLTLVVVVHDESAVCGPTMEAADLAVDAARARGFSVQVLLALVAPTEQTSAYFGQPHFDHWERRLLGEGDPAGARNALVGEVTGQHLVYLGAHDLISENWLAEGLATLVAAAAGGERVIAHPELSVEFDGGLAVQINVDQSSPLFTSHLLYFRDYYPGPCLAPREAHAEIPYRDGGGRDHHFAVETMAAGWRHVVVRDTAVFRRRPELDRPADADIEHAVTGGCAGLAIDEVNGLGRRS